MYNVYTHVHVHLCMCIIVLREMEVVFCVQLPVVAIDSYCPVISPFTGNEQGHLAVMLAMGSAQQVQVHVHCTCRHTEYHVLSPT